LLSGKRVEGRAEITENFDASADNEGDVAKGLVELETVITLRGLVELREASGVLTPVELARVYDHTSDGSTVTADPFGGRVDDDIGAMVDGSDKVTSSTKGVIDLTSY
jgi:hypothetical protein